MKRKSKAQLQAELDAANKRCADLADALIKQIMAGPIYYPVPYYPVPAAAPQWPLYPWAVGTPDVVVNESAPPISLGNMTAKSITLPPLTVKVSS